MAFRELPASAAWRHHEARQGFESVFLRARQSGYRVEGYTAAAEEGQVWAVRYVIDLDESWRTTSAGAWARAAKGDTAVRLDADGDGRWLVNGAAAPDLDGCLDVDLESSACTNAFPVQRLSLGIGRSADAPAAYVRAPALGVERLEQRYKRLDDDGSRQRYDYHCPALDFECRLTYDDAGLIVDYPGIASRVA